MLPILECPCDTQATSEISKLIGHNSYILTETEIFKNRALLATNIY